MPRRSSRSPLHNSHNRRFAKAQLTLVEHALCPFDATVSLQPQSVFQSSYRFTDTHRNRKTGTAHIGALRGLSAHDELYLWGLLALALNQPEPRPELMATPYWCLRQLGMISTHKKGGREFTLFRNAIERLAGVRYQNNFFYDAVRGEHRAVSFGFLNYSIPHDADSSRAWRFAWDPIFFELAQATGGALSFDLTLYRDLDPACRRLYLLLKKVFWRSDVAGPFDMHQLAVDVLGFSPSLAPRLLKQKLSRCIAVLYQGGILAFPDGVGRPEDLFQKAKRGRYHVELHKGPAFDHGDREGNADMGESPLYDPLQAIGLDEKAIGRVLATYSPRQIEQWADITLAAKERHGDQFFRVSPQAYFIDNLKAAATDHRTPPDWWRKMRKEEHQRELEQNRAKQRVLAEQPEEKDFDAYLKTDAKDAFERVTQSLIADLEKAGQSPAEAHSNALYMAMMHFRHRFQRGKPDTTNGFTQVGRIT